MLFSDYQNSIKSSPKSRKWHFRDSKLKNFLGPSALAFSHPNRKELPTALKSTLFQRLIKPRPKQFPTQVLAGSLNKRECRIPCNIRKNSNIF
jgi:hypothetical protein